MKLAPSTTSVKIAILDTGIDLNHPDVQACEENIKAKYNFLIKGANGTVHDLDGHGTFVASLLLDYAPDAEIYVVKIADRKPSSPHIIAKVFPSHTSPLFCLSVFGVGLLTRIRRYTMPWKSGTLTLSACLSASRLAKSKATKSCHMP